MRLNLKELIIEELSKNKLTASQLNNILDKGAVKNSVSLGHQGHDTYELWPAGKGYYNAGNPDDHTLNYEHVKTHHRIQLILGDDLTFFKKQLAPTFGKKPKDVLEIGEQSLQRKKEDKLAKTVSTHLHSHGIKHFYDHDEDNFPMIYVPVDQSN